MKYLFLIAVLSLSACGGGKKSKAVPEEVRGTWMRLNSINSIQSLEAGAKDKEDLKSLCQNFVDSNRFVLRAIEIQKNGDLYEILGFKDANIQTLEEPSAFVTKDLELILSGQEDQAKTNSDKDSSIILKYNAVDDQLTRFDRFRTSELRDVTYARVDFEDIQNYNNVITIKCRNAIDLTPESSDIPF